MLITINLSCVNTELKIKWHINRYTTEKPTTLNFTVIIHFSFSTPEINYYTCFYIHILLRGPCFESTFRYRNSLVTKGQSLVSHMPSNHTSHYLFAH